jgi:tetratricopeptide (TPR) repeat protein
MQDLINSAVTQIARGLTPEECKYYLMRALDDPESADAKCPPAAQALVLVAQGKKAATSGKSQVARESFQKAHEVYPSLPLDAKGEAGRLAAGPLVAEGRRLASIGKVQDAQALLQDAQKLHPGLSRDLEVQVQRLAAPVFVEKGTSLLLQENKIKEAIEAYKEAQKLDPSLQISAESWNSLCWEGSIQGYPSDVLEACNKAVEVEPSSPLIWAFRDSRGVARAMTGDFKGAIEDFEAFIKGSKYKKLKLQRQRWVASLQANKNPFTPAEIKTLWSDTSRGTR